MWQQEKKIKERMKYKKHEQNKKRYWYIDMLNRFPQDQTSFQSVPSLMTKMVSESLTRIADHNF